MDDGLHYVSWIPSIVTQLGCVLALVEFLWFGWFCFKFCILTTFLFIFLSAGG